MKPNSIYPFRFAAVVILSVMFVGCTYTLKSNDVPILETGSPLKGIRPKTFAFKEFRDARGTVRGTFGEVLNVSKDPYLFKKEGIDTCRLDQLPTSFVATVIRKELERNSHTCITYSAQSNPDFIIEGSVYKFGPKSGGRGHVAQVAVKLTVNPIFPGKEVLIKTYEGQGAPDFHLYACKTPLHRALLAMVKEMSTDLDLIAFLEK